ncbi:2-phosphosulfolactate phosphatase [Sulfurimonas sp. HSL-3221]|uniref:2-phosphosulfolactate phosphatase n=1 Tax=Thiomicrolovo TaxID=3451667 RepID=UPI001E2C093D|nr:2-phosphosulfolactate phosphatase [Sulfurimonas sp. HSL-3221]UFS63649.1 2-phosphosulfolactate phosphatase [Sulfurimonas sp. HSL-3221]
MTLRVEIFRGNDLALPDSEVNVVIDVVRAFTVAHYAFLRGAAEILLVPDVAAAFAVRKERPEVLLAGEVGGLPIEGFDLDNSPVRFASAELEGLIIVQKTTNGVKAALHSLGAPTVLLTGFSNAEATVRYLQAHYGGTDARINLVASHPTGDEDFACAEYIRSQLLGEAMDTDEVRRRIYGCETVVKFLDPARPEFNAEDIDYCATSLPPAFVMAVYQGALWTSVRKVTL